MSSETKDQLVKNVKAWIQMDNEIKEFQKQIKDRKDKKKRIYRNVASHYERQ